VTTLAVEKEEQAAPLLFRCPHSWLAVFACTDAATSTTLAQQSQVDCLPLIK